MEVGEDELIEAIGKVLSGPGEDVRVGVGDDAAVLAPGSGELVVTTDALVEDTHFSLGAIAARDLGHKAIAVNLSDLAAMAASPRYAVCALTLSDRVDAAWTMELFGGMRECCDEYALWLVGGNLARGSEVSIAVTAIGEVARGRAVLRSGAGPGDRIVVTGRLGGSAAGLRLASKHGGWSADEREAIVRHDRPTPRVGEAALLARHGATAMIDLSDGLALDLARLCRASGVGASIRIQEVPADPLAKPGEVLGGGEDYELVATLPGDDAVGVAASELRELFGVALTEIGSIMEGQGVQAVDADGRSRPLDPTGWDHFR